MLEPVEERWRSAALETLASPTLTEEETMEWSGFQEDAKIY